MNMIGSRAFILSLLAMSAVFVDRLPAFLLFVYRRILDLCLLDR